MCRAIVGEGMMDNSLLDLLGHAILHPWLIAGFFYKPLKPFFLTPSLHQAFQD